MGPCNWSSKEVSKVLDVAALVHRCLGQRSRGYRPIFDPMLRDVSGVGHGAISLNMMSPILQLKLFYTNEK